MVKEFLKNIFVTQENVSYFGLPPIHESFSPHNAGLFKEYYLSGGSGYVLLVMSLILVVYYLLFGEKKERTVARFIFGLLLFFTVTEQAYKTPGKSVFFSNTLFLPVPNISVGFIYALCLFGLVFLVNFSRKKLFRHLGSGAKKVASFSLVILFLMLTMPIFIGRI